MLSSLKKSGTPPSSPWHADFRDTSQLPDVRVIRTSFFLNAIGITALLGSALYLVQQQMGIRQTDRDIETAQQTLQTNSAANDEALALSRQFQLTADKADRVRGFVLSSPRPTQIILACLGTLPPKVTLNALRVGPDTLTLSGQVSSTAADSAGIVEKFLDNLRKEEKLKQAFPKVELQQMVPGAEDAGVMFEILLKEAPASTEAKKPQPKADQIKDKGEP